MRLNPFRSREAKNPWGDYEKVGQPPPIGLHPLLDLQAMQYSIARTLWEICRTHETYDRMLRWQGRLMLFVALINVYWAVMWLGRTYGWW